MITNREKIFLNSKEEYLNIALGQHSGYIVVHEIEQPFNQEKGTFEVSFVVKRLSDGKFFASEYARLIFGNHWIKEFSLMEVFLKEKITYHYE